ncbi:MAG: hypothetical protein ACPF8V_11300, partial [Luteibaculum sp.]
MVVSEYKYDNALAERHLVNILHENKSLEQAISNLMDTIYRIKASQDCEALMRTINKKKLALVEQKIPEISEEVTYLDQRIRASFKYPSMRTIQELSKLHSRCVQTWNMIQTELR